MLKTNGTLPKRIIKKKGNWLPKLARYYRFDLLKNETYYEKTAKIALKELNVSFEEQRIFYFGSSFYIVDFYLPKYKIVLEIDGEYHEDIDIKMKDSWRTKNLLSLGIYKVVRVLNRNCTIENIKTVVKQEIKRYIEQYDHTKSNRN